MPRHLNDIATTIVAVVEAETTALQTAQLMRRHHVGALVVVDAHEKTRPIGIVTDRDLVLAVMAEGLDPAVFTASDIMSGELVVARASLELQDGVALMHERKVRRLVRHIDPWSILKLALLMCLCLWVVGLIAAVVVWSVANNTGALDSLERFFNESLQLEDFQLSGDVLFRQFGLISLLCALGTTATIVVATLVFNLISDIIGGVWISVIEEETARPIDPDEAGGSGTHVRPR